MLRNLNQSFSGRRILGIPQVGEPASAIPATGDQGASLLYNKQQGGDPVGCLYRIWMTSQPASGTLTVYEDGSFSLVGANDGTYTAGERIDKYDPAVGLFSTDTGTAQFAVGVGSTALAGAAIAQASASGTLTTAIRLAGTASAVATASGTLLGSAAALAGSAVAQASASGALSTAIRLAGSAVAQATAAGTLTSMAVVSGSITVPASRTARFTAAARVVVFGTENNLGALLVSGGPAYRNNKWYLNKSPGDRLWYVADVTKDLADAATTIQSVAVLTAGVVPGSVTFSGSLISLMISGGDTALADNYCTLRVTCVDSEVFDRTFHFVLVTDQSWVFAKDPDDQRFYAFDLSPDIAATGSALDSVGTPVAVGVSGLTVPIIQGSRAIIKVGGLSAVGANSCALPLNLANGEILVRSIYFTEIDN